MRWWRRRELDVPVDAERSYCTTCAGPVFVDAELGGVWAHVRLRDGWHMVQRPLPPDPSWPPGR